MNFQFSWRLFSRAVFSLLLLALLQACGASDNAFLGAQATADALRLGSGTGTTFQDGVVSVADSGANTTVSVNLVDASGNLSTSDAQYQFSSTCVTQGAATFDNTLVTNKTGTASVIYTDQGCTVDNTFTVTANVIDTQASLTASTIVSTKNASVRLGSGSGSTFNSGTLALSANKIPATGSLTITANIVDAAGAAFTSNIAVTFSSACVSNNEASLSNTIVNTSNGTATTTYTASTCSGSDTITATAQSNGVTLTASANLTLMPNRIGSTATGPFVEGNIGLGLSNISINGNTSVSVQIVDFNGNPVTSLHKVDFASDCTVSKDASFDKSGSVNTTSGTASLNYSSTTCSGNDAIRVTTKSGGDTLTATGSVSIAAAALGSIEFSSASNSLIALKGLGTSTLPETTTVTFTVRDDQGQPVSAEIVNFSLDTSVGGLSLATNTDVSDGTGVVSVVVQSGSSPTTFRVNAVANSNTSIATQSASISIATGPATQKALSLSASTLNPRGFDHDGTTSTITARAADRYGNPIQDGTAISFTTEGGFISPSCTTVNGACSVTWTSSNPRPLPDGRATILAHLTGEESFTDNNSNGIFDDADSFNSGNASEALSADDDLPEAFRDDNEDGIHNAGEFFVNFDNSPITTNNGYTNDDNKFSGAGCTHATLCSGSDSITIFAELVLVMAEDNASFDDDQAAGANSLTNLTIANKGTKEVIYTIEGFSTGQVLPNNTSISFAMTGSSDCSIEGTSAFTIGSTNSKASGINDYKIKYVCNGTAGSGTMTISVNIPGVIAFTRSLNVTQL